MGTSSTYNCLIQSVSFEMMLQNQTNCNVKVQIYDLICRRDMGSNTTNYDPLTAWTTGITDAR